MTFLSSTLPEHLVNMEIGSAAIVALLGYAVVFFGIVLLMVVMMIMGRIFIAKASKAAAPKVAAPKAAAPKAAAPAAAPAPVAAPAVAPGTAGQLKLHDVPPKTAAMIMAIVADTMGKPLNELRFISIKEVK